MIPRDAVKLARHRHGAGWARVVHRATGIPLGEVALWPDGVWVAYTQAPNSNDEGCGEGGTREDAVEVLLHLDAHLPAHHELRDGSTARTIREAEEVEDRKLDPEGWAWWDKVRPLFPGEVP